MTIVTTLSLTLVKGSQNHRPYSDYLIEGVPVWQVENRGMTEEEGEAYKQ